MDKPTVFISYSHKDEIWKDRLRPHLSALELDERIVVWDDRKIDVGDRWYPEIEAAIKRARIAVCLISADYLASSFCVKEEIPVLLQRREKEGVLILPVLIRPCFWEKTEWLSEIQMLPRDGKSVAAHFKDDWDTIFTDVAKLIFEVIDNASYQPPAPPAPAWPPPEKLDLSRLPVTGSELFGRQKDLALLDDAWDAAAVNVLSFIAWGGVGKSTLVNKWLERLAKDNYRGARRVFAWSFYSQGTSDRATSADLFINAALAWFGDDNPTAGSPWDKGERLARLVRRERTLLVLDGLEPLQSSQAYERGKIKDPALSTLVEELARENPGLCLITTRERIRELDEKAGGSGISTGSGSDRVLNADDPLATARGTDSVRQINLELLSPEAGRALLRIGGVRGTDEELERAAESFGYHALALNLLAVYLQDLPGHHISAAAQIPDLDIPEAAGKHPRRMIAAFERKFGEGPEIEVLRMLGLFDRPADGAALAALRKAPKIPGLTDYIGEQAEAAWLRAVQTLRKYKLLAAESHHEPDELDAHPLVREHFGELLQHVHPEAWTAGNLRLYEHLTRTTKEFPDTIEEMTPLFAAVTHGCAAGRHQDVLYALFERRIERKEEFFSSYKLGTFGANLAAFSGFFDTTRKQPLAHLSETDQAYILGRVGYYLRALGRHTEASHPLLLSLEKLIKLKDWETAARRASNICMLYKSTGKLRLALDYAQKSVNWADRSGDLYNRMFNRTSLANILHQLGSLTEADNLFCEAEKIQRLRQPEYQFLYSVEGFRYCDLLLSQGKFQDAQIRANQAIKIARSNNLLLAIALDYLSLGRVYLLQVCHKEKSYLDYATLNLELAVTSLRQAGRQDYLPLGLLAHAAWARVAEQFDRATRDLAEAFTIAERGEMSLYLADCHLEAARLALARHDPAQARDAWQQAAALITQTGYHRRDGELAEIKGQLS